MEIHWVLVPRYPNWFPDYFKSNFNFAFHVLQTKSVIMTTYYYVREIKNCVLCFKIWVGHEL